MHFADPITERQAEMEHPFELDQGLVQHGDQTIISACSRDGEMELAVSLQEDRLAVLVAGLIIRIAEPIKPVEISRIHLACRKLDAGDLDDLAKLKEIVQIAKRDRLGAISLTPDRLQKSEQRQPVDRGTRRSPPDIKLRGKLGLGHDRARHDFTTDDRLADGIEGFIALTQPLARLLRLPAQRYNMSHNPC